MASLTSESENLSQVLLFHPLMVIFFIRAGQRPHHDRCPHYVTKRLFVLYRTVYQE
ncbi:Uncharacterized protein EbC_pEb17201140 (plasmid) [Erwinia billingiae Eb661]|uniref:Uncharacterized protein n=1 Tax=Erwinia billingiae (strain Eb661) TaxID=634500 RepID=D8MJW9_ERWBE|nr:Uncharacterized protein EbC_pEb17201140 [Erwinia billingiae Eb661]